LRAGELLREWSILAPTLREEELEARQAHLVVELVFAILEVVAAHPSPAPSHGVGHVRRVVAHGLAIAASEGLAEPDCARLLLAAAAHDLGRLKLIADGPELYHAEVSGLLICELGPAAAALPIAVSAPVRYAVTAHTAIRKETDHWFRCADDLRAADSLDAIGTGSGLLRHILSDSNFFGLPTRLTLEGSAAGWLSEWRMRSLNDPPYPPSRIPWARLERLTREASGRVLIADLPSARGETDAWQARFRALVEVCEPDVPPYQVERIITALGALELREIERWAALIATIEKTWQAEAGWLTALLGSAIYAGDRLTAPIAAGLLAQGVARLPVDAQPRSD
jgi:hypothetical protein